jgi:hypothetical protein
VVSCSLHWLLTTLDDGMQRSLWYTDLEEYRGEAEHVPQNT